MAKKEKVVKEKKQTSYFKEMKAELKKVVWPTPKELLDNTVAVIAFVLIIAIIVFVLDLCFDNLNKYGITNLQEKVQSSFQTTVEDESEDDLSSDETTDEEEGNDDSSSESTEVEAQVETTTQSQEDTAEENQENQENTENVTVESNE